MSEVNETDRQPDEPLEHYAARLALINHDADVAEQAKKESEVPAK